MTSTKLSLQQIIEYVEDLAVEEQELLIELVQKRRIQTRRSEIARNAITTLEALRQGSAQRGSFEDLCADLRSQE
jgi:hypothetical protein